MLQAQPQARGTANRRKTRSLDFEEADGVVSLDEGACLVQAGCENKGTVFLFDESQLVMEEFLEDINNILTSGELLQSGFRHFKCAFVPQCPAVLTCAAQLHHPAGHHVCKYHSRPWWGSEQCRVIHSPTLLV